MAFRRPGEDSSSPSLGYRLSSNRQPGIDEANDRGIGSLRQQGMGRMDPRFNPEGMPRMPRRMERMEPYLGPRFPDKFKDYLDRNLNPMMPRERQGRGIEGLRMSEADSYSPQNLIQMLQDAQDAGNEDEADMLYNDLEMRFPTLADVDDDNTAVQSLFGQGYSMEEIMDIMAARPMSA